MRLTIYLLTVFRADEIPLLRLSGQMVGKSYFDKHGFDIPILFESKEGLGLIVPPPSFTIQDVEDYVGKLIFSR
jgi:hypothetical protein